MNKDKTKILVDVIRTKVEERDKKRGRTDGKVSNFSSLDRGNSWKKRK